MPNSLKVKVAVYLILIKDNKVLFARRKDTGWQDGKLTLPSGHIEQGEFPHEAAVRELKEEIGINIDSHQLKLSYITYFKDRYVNFYFIVNEWKGEPQNMESYECSELVWIYMNNANDEFAESVFESTQRALRNNNFYSEFA